MRSIARSRIISAAEFTVFMTPMKNLLNLMLNLIDGKERKQISWIFLSFFYAQVVKLVDTPDLGSGAARCVGSSPILGTLPNVLSEMARCSVFFYAQIPAEIVL